MSTEYDDILNAMQPGKPNDANARAVPPPQSPVISAPPQSPGISALPPANTQVDQVDPKVVVKHTINNSDGSTSVFTGQPHPSQLPAPFTPGFVQPYQPRQKGPGHFDLPTWEQFFREDPGLQSDNSRTGMMGRGYLANIDRQSADQDRLAMQGVSAQVASMGSAIRGELQNQKLDQENRALALRERSVGAREDEGKAKNELNNARVEQLRQHADFFAKNPSGMETGTTSDGRKYTRISNGREFKYSFDAIPATGKPVRTEHRENGDDVVFYDMGNGKLSRPVIFHAEKPQTDVVQSSNPERTLVTTTHVPRGTAPTIVDGKVVPPSAPPAAAAPVAPKVLLSKNGRSYQRGPNGELTWLN